MKLKHFFLTGFLLIIIFFITMITVTKEKLEQKEKLNYKLRTLPHLPVVAIGTNKNTNWLNTSNPTIILFFNSECSHCQYGATAIHKRVQEFNKANLLFISDEEEGKIEAFSKAYKLDNKPNIWWLKMQPEQVYNTFGNIGVPHIWVYNKEGKLVKEFRGETKVEALLEWL